MNIMIVEGNPELARLWAAPLEYDGHHVTTVSSQAEAVLKLCESRIDAIVLDLDLGEDSALAVADFASYRQPDARVVVVTRDRYFSDGSIFSHLVNARAIVPATTEPRDLSLMVEHYALAS